MGHENFDCIEEANFDAALRLALSDDLDDPMVDLAKRDPWMAAMTVSVLMARAMGDRDTVRKMKWKMGAAELAWRVYLRWSPFISYAHEMIHLVPAKEFEKLTIIVGNWKLKKGKVASFDHPDYPGDYAVLTLGIKAFKSMDYLENVMKHEIIHGVIGVPCNGEEAHGNAFNALAKIVGIPERFRD